MAQKPVPKVFQRGLGRFIYQTLNDTSSAESSKILVFPTLGYAPETSLEVGLRTFSLYYAKDDTTVNRLSEITLYTFLTLRGQFGAQLENAVYSDQNKYFLLGRVRYQQFPLLYYGIGHETQPHNPALVNSNQIQFRQRVLRKVYASWYAGLEVDYQNIHRVSFEHSDSSAFIRPVGSEGSSSVGVGVAIVNDTRKNVLNVRNGQFLEAGFLAYRQAVGSDFDYQSIVIDGRIYRPLGKPNRIIAAQLSGVLMSGTVPFNNMALLGGENLMRGYYLGRYRDKNLIAMQTEIRWLPFSFSKRWGGTVFAGLGTVAPTLDKIQFNQFRWAVGGGLRFLFFQRKDVFLRADVGVTREGTGLYFSLGEAF
ncbi:BamA/TamA family outer membrane protein [Spirosoma harenae]